MSERANCIGRIGTPCSRSRSSDEPRQRRWRGSALRVAGVLLMLLLTWPTASIGQAVAEPESTLVPTAMLRRATAVIDSLDLVIAYKDAEIAMCDSNAAINDRFWRRASAFDKESCERQLDAARTSTWDRLNDILITAGAVYVGAAAVR